MPDLIEPIRWTPAMARALPDDGNRYEVVHGELLVTPAPTKWHQVLLMRLNLELARWLGDAARRQLLWSPADITEGPDTLVQPDLFVIAPDAARRESWPELHELLLVVEVLSPSTRRHDRGIKRRRYQEAGVPTYWIVVPDDRSVEVWTPTDSAPVIERNRLHWSPPGAGRPFELELTPLFEPL